MILHSKNKQKIFLIFLLSRIIYGFIIFSTGCGLADLYTYCDNEHYIAIAENGYMEEWQTAFFPLIPVLIRIIGQKGVFIINQIAALFSMYILDFLADDLYVVELYAFSVISFFSLMMYTESLLFFLSILAYYLFKKRYLDLRLGIIIGLCVFTKAIGAMIYISVFISMVFLYFKKQQKKEAFIKVFLPATIIGSVYLIYLQNKFGNWRLFIDCQYNDWGRIRTNFIQEISLQIKYIFSEARYIYKINEVISLTMVILIIYELLRYIRVNMLEKNNFCDVLVLALYTFLSIVSINGTIRVPINNAPTTSFYRYYYCIFPIFLFSGKLNKHEKQIIYIISSGLSFSVAYLFSKNFYFY